MTSYTRDSLRRIPWREVVSCVRTSEQGQGQFSQYQSQYGVQSIRCQVVGLEKYSAHDWRAATSVQRAPVTWREWACALKYELSVMPKYSKQINSSPPSAAYICVGELDQHWFR